MSFLVSSGLYVIGGSSIFLSDRLSKWLALRYLERAFPLTNFLSFDLVMNRGISWSLFHSASDTTFLVLTIMIIAIISGLLTHTIVRWYRGYTIIGEIMTLVGAISNLIDRLIYGGVIDFISFSYGTWSFPIFNIADCSIVLGVVIMFFYAYQNP